MQAANPHAAMKDLTKEMAKEWQTVSADERAECDRIALANKTAYEEAMRIYQEQQVAAAADGGAAADVKARAEREGGLCVCRRGRALPAACRAARR